MTQPFLELRRHQMVALGRGSLAALRAAVMRGAEGDGAAVLQEAGYAGSDALYRAFRAWLADRGDGSGGDPGELTLEEFTERASAFFREAGWGSFRLESIHDAVASVDSDDWVEAEPSEAVEH